jgi:hypothetical protein
MQFKIKQAQIETISIRKRRTILVAFSMIPIYKENEITHCRCKGRIRGKETRKKKNN